MKKSIIIFLALLGAGCSTISSSTSNPMVVRKFGGDLAAKLVTMEVLSNAAEPYFVDFDIKLLNKSKEPIQTNMFSDSVTLFDSAGAKYQIDIVKNGGYDGKIVNPNTTFYSRQYVFDQNLIRLFKEEKITKIEYRIGSADLTIVLERIPYDPRLYV